MLLCATITFISREVHMATAEELIHAAQQEVKCINASEAANIASKDGAIIIDVREPKENEKAAIPIAVNIPRGVLEYKIADVCLDKTTPIMVHCGGGGRASLAAQTLNKLGYENVYAVLAKFDDLKESLKTLDR